MDSCSLVLGLRFTAVSSARQKRSLIPKESLSSRDTSVKRLPRYPFLSTLTLVFIASELPSNTIVHRSRFIEHLIMDSPFLVHLEALFQARTSFPLPKPRPVALNPLTVWPFVFTTRDFAPRTVWATRLFDKAAVYLILITGDYAAIWRITAYGNDMVFDQSGNLHSTQGTKYSCDAVEARRPR
uniref:Uncharacterized protein n=1 Tax=Steinernema glaseri TaxID=37863 RepID=A0A1I7Y5W6_9BILA